MFNHWCDFLEQAGGHHVGDPCSREYVINPYWSWLLLGVFWLSDATNDVQFYWAVWLQWRRVCWSRWCFGVSTCWKIKKWLNKTDGTRHWRHFKAGKDTVLSYGNRAPRAGKLLHLIVPISLYKSKHVPEFLYDSFRRYRSTLKSMVCCPSTLQKWDFLKVWIALKPTWVYFRFLFMSVPSSHPSKHSCLSSTPKMFLVHVKVPIPSK